MPVAPVLPFDRTHLTPGTRLTVAVSGGADSIALLRTLHAANRLPRDPLGLGLSALHVHHGLRAQAADLDQHFVEDLCATLDVPLTVRSVDTPARISETSESIEQAARNLRYGTFHDLLASGVADAVATAHTADDQAETVLMKLLRGAWTDVLAGISPVLELSLGNGQSGHVLRPLLGTDRTAIESYLRSLDQPWRTDETNADPTFTRNRLRLEILPALRNLNPALNSTLASLAEIARGEESFWQTELARLLPQFVTSGRPVRGGGRSNATAPGVQTLALEIDRIRSLHPALLRRILRAVARELGSRLSSAETARLLAFAGLGPAIATVPSRPGATLALANNLVAERSIRELRLSLQAMPPRPSPRTTVTARPERSSNCHDGKASPR